MITDNYRMNTTSYPYNYSRWQSGGVAQNANLKQNNISFKSAAAGTVVTIGVGLGVAFGLFKVVKADEMQLAAKYPYFRRKNLDKIIEDFEEGVNFTEGPSTKNRRAQDMIECLELAKQEKYTAEDADYINKTVEAFIKEYYTDTKSLSALELAYKRCFEKDLGLYKTKETLYINEATLDRIAKYESDMQKLNLLPKEKITELAENLKSHVRGEPLKGDISDNIMSLFHICRKNPTVMKHTEEVVQEVTGTRFNSFFTKIKNLPYSPDLLNPEEGTTLAKKAIGAKKGIQAKNTQARVIQSTTEVINKLRKKA